MKILRKLAQGGIYSNKLVAKELGADEGLIEQMITQLKHLGYIEKDDMKNLSSSCNCRHSSCSRKGNCCCNNHNIDISIWKITQKGRQAL